jgi:hypothetical protein
VKAYKKQIIVDVRGPLLEREAVPTPHGFVQAEVGDFILRDGDEEWPIGPDRFARTYQEVDATLEQDTKSERPAVTEFSVIKREDVIA